MGVVLLSGTVRPIPKIPTSELGLIGRGVLDRVTQTLSSSSLRGTFIAAFPVAIFFKAVSLLSAEPVQSAAFAAGSAVLIAACVFLLLIGTFPERWSPEAAVAAGISPKVVRGVAGRVGVALRSGYDGDARLNARRLLPLLGGLGVALLLLVLPHLHSFGLVIPEALSQGRLDAAHEQSKVMRLVGRYGELSTKLVGMVLVVGVIWMAVSPAQQLRQMRRFSVFLPHAVFPRQARSVWTMSRRFAVGSGVVGILTFGSSLGWQGLWGGSLRVSSEAIVRESAVSGGDGDGPLVHIRLAGPDLPEVSKHLYRLNSLQTLTILGACTHRISLGRVSGLQQYRGPASCIEGPSATPLSLSDLEGIEGFRDWRSTFVMRFEQPCTIGSDEITLPQHLTDVSFESEECASRLAGSLAGLNWNAQVWIVTEKEITLDWFDERHSHLILLVSSLSRASDQGVGHIRKLFTVAELETVGRLGSARQLEWLSLSGSGLHDQEVVLELTTSIESLERLESLELNMETGIVQARGRAEIQELLRGLLRSLE